MKINKTLILLPLLIGSTSSIWAQSATAPYSRKSSSPTAYVKYQGAKTNNIIPNISSLLQWGPILIKPHIDYRYAEASGVNSDEQGNPNDTTIQTVSPGLSFIIGEHWTLDYTSRWTYYSEDTFEDARDETLNLAGWAQTANWNIGFRHNYSTDSSTLVETARQTLSETHTSALTASTQLSRKLALDGSLSYTARNAAEFEDTSTYSTLQWLRYENSPRLNTSIGLGGGYSQIDNGINSSFQKFLLRTNLQLTQKLDLSINGGVETRQLKVDGSNNLTNPIYSAILTYQPLDQTTISLDLSRSVGVSPFSNSVTENENWTVNFNQRFLGKYFFDFTTSNRDSDYISNDGTNRTTRSNEYLSYSYKISTDILENGRISIFYFSSENQATESNLEFSSNEIGAEISFDF